MSEQAEAIEVSEEAPLVNFEKPEDQPQEQQSRPVDTTDSYRRRDNHQRLAPPVYWRRGSAVHKSWDFDADRRAWIHWF